MHHEAQTQEQRSATASAAASSEPRPRDSGHGALGDRALLRWGVKPFLLTGDLLACGVAAVLLDRDPGVDTVLFLALTALLLMGGGLYRSRLSLSALDDLPALGGRTLAGAALALCAALAAGLLDAGAARRMLWTGVLAAALVVLTRAGAYSVVRRCRRRGWVAHQTLVLGAGRIGGQLAALLLEHPAYGLQPIGFLDDDPLLDMADRPVPVLGRTGDLAEVLVDHCVRDVIVAFGALPESNMVEIIRTCDRLDVEIFFVPRLFELHHAGRDIEQVWGIPLLRLRRAAFRSFSWRLKRLFDIVVAGTALVALSPLLAGCAVAVRLEGGPGVLFRQTRVGLDGQAFEVLKFRSLRPTDELESETTWNIAADSRLGAVGRLLRSTSMDELPQLWNVLRGDMTLVGPRPERPHFVDIFATTTPRYMARHRVPAGLTGWAQVHGLRGDTSIEDRARFDNSYIENWSLWADVKILLRTVSSVLRRAGG